MISSLKTAYRIGFSSALNRDCWSGYNEFTKWPFDKEKDNLLGRFLEGFQAGLNTVKEVRREMKDFLLAGEWNRDVA